MGAEERGLPPLHRAEGSRFSSIRASWSGETVVLIGGGPSASPEQFETIRSALLQKKCRAIAINDSYLAVPEAQILYFADFLWWKHHKDRPAFRAFAGQKCSIENAGLSVEEADVHLLRNAGESGLSSSRDGLCTGRNSGYQAIGLGIAAGASRLILVGFDMRFRDGRSHWHGGHAFRREIEDLHYRVGYAPFFSPLALIEGVEILNASPGSALRCFREVDLGEALEGEVECSR